MCVLSPHWSTQKRVSRANANRSAGTVVVPVQDLFEDSHRAPVSWLAPGYTVYRRPRMEGEGVPTTTELV